MKTQASGVAGTHPERPLDRQRRRLIRLAGLMAGIGLMGGRPLGALAAETVTLPFANGTRPLVTYPQKRPLMLLTSRPVQLETPICAVQRGRRHPQ